MSLRATASAAGLTVALMTAAGCGSDVHMALTSPQDGQTVRRATIHVVGKVEPVRATVRINEHQVPVRDGAFAVSVPLHRGRNRINVAAASGGRQSDIRDLIVRRGRTTRQIAAARRHRLAAARRAAAAARAARRARRAAGPRYPEFVRRYYMASCKVRGTTSGCRCTLRYLEAHASLGALRQAELQMVRGGRAPRFLIAAVTACRSAGA